MSEDHLKLSDSADTGALPNGDMQGAGDAGQVLAAPVGKLDADQWMAEDLDGVTESLYGSGNLNYLLLQSGQTNAALISNSSFSPAQGLHGLDPRYASAGISQQGAPLVASGDTGGQSGTPNISYQYGRALSAPNSHDGQTVNGTLGSVGAAAGGHDGIGGQDGAHAYGGGTSVSGHGGGDGRQGGGTAVAGNVTNVTNQHIEVVDTTNVINHTTIVAGPVTNIVNTVIDQVVNHSVIDNTVVTTVNTVLTNIINNLPGTGDHGGGHSGPVDTDVSVGGISLPVNVILDPVESLVGDIDVKGTVGTVFGPGEYHNSAGDHDITGSAVIDLIGGHLGDVQVSLPLDLVEAVVGDIDIDLSAATDLLGHQAPGVIDSLPGGTGVTTVISIVGDGLHDVATGIIGQTGNDHGHDHDLGGGLTLGDTQIIGGNLALDPVEDLVGDLDIGGHTVLLGSGETSNAAGDTDIRVGLDLGIAPVIHLDIPLDAVEAITGDIDLDLNLATSPLGDLAGGLIDQGHGGTGGDAVPAQIGEGVQDAVAATGVLPVVSALVHDVVGDGVGITQVNATLDAVMNNPAVVDITSNVGDALNLSNGGILPVAQDAADQLGSALHDATGVDTLLNQIGQVITGQSDGSAAPILSGVGEPLQDLVSDPAAAIQGALSQLGDVTDSAVPVVQGAVDEGAAQVQDIVTNVVDVVTHIVTDLQSAVSDVADASTPTVHGIVDQVSETAQATTDAVVAQVQDLVSALPVAAPVVTEVQSVVQDVTNAATPVQDALGSGISQVQVAVEALPVAPVIAEVQSVASEITGNAAPVVQSLVDQLAHGLQDVVGGAGPVIDNVATVLAPVIAAAPAPVAQIVADLGGSVSHATGDLLGGITGQTGPDSDVSIGVGPTLGLPLNHVENLTGDIDLGTAAQVLGLGDAHAGSGQVAAASQLGALGGQLADIGANLSIAPVTAVTGNTGVNLGLAVEVLGSTADHLVNSGAGGTGSGTLLGAVSHDTASLVDALVPQLGQSTTHDAGITVTNTIGTGAADIVSTPVAVATSPLESLTGSTLGVHIDNALTPGVVTAQPVASHDVTVSTGVNVGSTTLIPHVEIPVSVPIVQQITGNIDLHINTAVNLMTTTPAVISAPALDTSATHAVTAVTTTATVGAVTDLAHAVSGWTESTITATTQAVAATVPHATTTAGSVLSSPVGTVSTGLSSLINKTSALDLHTPTHHGLFG